MGKITRRELLGTSALVVGTAALPGLGLEGSGNDTAARKKMKIMVTGGHPDDPESGCGGTIALYSNLGHEVVILYLTRGEAGIEGKRAQEAAVIRTAECEKACAILKARPLFAGQIDGSTEINAERSHPRPRIEAPSSHLLARANSGSLFRPRSLTGWEPCFRVARDCGAGARF